MLGGCRFWSDKEAVQRTDFDTKGDIAKVKELSLKANRAVSFSSKDAWVKSLGIPLHTTYKYALLSILNMSIYRD